MASYCRRSRKGLVQEDVASRDNSFAKAESQHLVTACALPCRAVLRFKLELANPSTTRGPDASLSKP